MYFVCSCRHPESCFELCNVRVHHVVCTAVRLPSLYLRHFQPDYFFIKYLLHGFVTVLFLCLNIVHINIILISVFFVD